MKLKLLPALVVVLGVAALMWRQMQVEPLKVSGFIEADEIRVGSRVGGRVQEVLVEEGQSVKLDALLVRLEPFDLLERLAEAKGTLAAAVAESDKLSAGFRSEETARAGACGTRPTPAIRRPWPGRECRRSRRPATTWCRPRPTWN